MRCFVNFGLIVSVVLIVPSRWTEACSCQQTHRQQQFCNADFAIRAKIKGSELIYSKSITQLNGKNVTHRWPVRKLYHIRINKILRNSTSLGDVGRLHKLYTAAFDSMCGVTTLKRRTKYLITGSVWNGDLHLSLCNWHHEWHRLSSKQKRAASHHYQEQCGKCKVVTCGQSYGGHCPETAVHPDQCLWNIKQDKDSCYNLYSVCKHLGNGQCKWSRNKHWRSCVLKNPLLKHVIPKKRRGKTSNIKRNRKIVLPTKVNINNRVPFREPLAKSHVPYRVSHLLKQQGATRKEMQRDGIASRKQHPHMKLIPSYGKDSEYKDSTFRWAELSRKFAQMKAQDKIMHGLDSIVKYAESILGTKSTPNHDKINKKRVKENHQRAHQLRSDHRQARPTNKRIAKQLLRPILPSTVLHRPRQHRQSQLRQHRQNFERRRMIDHGGLIP